MQRWNLPVFLDTDVDLETVAEIVALGGEEDDDDENDDGRRRSRSDDDDDDGRSGPSFAVIERDNQAGTDARIKRIYRFSVAGLEPTTQEEGDFPVVHKELVRDLIADLLSDNGAVIEKVEGLTVLPNGDTLFVTDNDGVDDSSGETQLQNLGDIF